MKIMDKQVIILVSGRAGTGKSTFSNIGVRKAVEQGFKAGISTFATSLKNIAIEGGWDGNKDVAGRQLLIDIGAAFIKYDIDTWAKLCYNNIESITDFVFIDDWRFKNELAFMEKEELKGNISLFKVRILSPDRESLVGTTQYNDKSEVDLLDIEDSYFNFVIDNSGSIRDLENSVVSVIEEIKKLVGFW